MEVIKKMIKPIPQDYEVTRFVADDGTEFDNERACLNYEYDKKFQEDMKRIDKYRIPNYDDQIPLHADACYSECSTYRWYKVNNAEELEEIEEVYGEPVRDIDQYPTIVCMEREDENYIGQPYSISLDTIKQITKEFYKGLKIEVVFKEKGEG